MAAMKIGYSGAVSAIPQMDAAERAAQQVARQQARVLHAKPMNPYGINKAEAITCRETTTGSYEAVLSGMEPANYDVDSSCKGQIVDLWI